MKILVVHTNYTQYGGEDAVVKQEINLLKNNHEVESIIFKNRKGLKGLLQFLISIWNLKSAYIVKKKINAFNPDIIHIHNWHFASGPMIIRTAAKFKTPIVHSLHNYRLICPSGTLMLKNKLFTESIKRNFPWTAVVKKVYKNSRILTFWLAVIVWFHNKIGTWDLVNSYICLTPSAIDLFTTSNINIDSSKFVSKPNFSSPNKNRKVFDREDYFLFIGRLSEEKGVRLLINAFEKLSFKLKIAGEGSLKSYVIESSKNNSNITYLGLLNNEEVSVELNKTNALIFPSIWLEPFGLVITEAFSNACAVISTNIGAPYSIVDNNNNGFHFESNNLLDLILVIEKWMLLSRNEKESMRNNALKTFLSKYSPEKQYEFFNNIYSNVLENK